MGVAAHLYMCVKYICTAPWRWLAVGRSDKTDRKKETPPPSPFLIQRILCDAVLDSDALISGYARVAHLNASDSTVLLRKVQQRGPRALANVVIAKVNVVEGGVRGGDGAEHPHRVVPQSIVGEHQPLQRRGALNDEEQRREPLVPNVVAAKVQLLAEGDAGPVRKLRP